MPYFFKEKMKMLKLNAAYSKKVPAEGEYTSQSYHASIEVELRTVSARSS